MKKGLTILLRAFVSFGLLGLLFWMMREDIGSIWGTIAGCDIRYILLAALLFTFNVSFLAFRFKVVFEGENLELSFPAALRLTLVGYFFNNFMPTAVGGDIVKAHYAAKANGQRMKSYASVMMDRFIGLYTFLVVAAIALLVDRGRTGTQGLKPLVFSFVAVGVLGFIAAANTRVAGFLENAFDRLHMFSIGEKLKSLYSIVHDYRNRKKVLVKSFLSSILGQSLYFVIVFLFFRSLGYEMSLGNVFLIMPVVTFVSMMPSIGGLGVREGAIVAFFAPIAGKDIAFAVSLLLLMGLLLVSVAGGLVYLYWMVTGFRDKDEDQV